MKKNEILKVSDMAELRFVKSLPDGDYNLDIEIEAREDGLLIEEFILVPWQWIQSAFLTLYGQPLASSRLESLVEHGNCETKCSEYTNKLGT
jgi:hypothetical protein